MTRQQDRRAVGCALPNRVLKDLLHQRIEPRRRFIQDEQIDVGRERCDECDLLAIPFRVRIATLRRVEVEAVDQFGATLRWQAAMARGEHVDALTAGHAGPQRYVTGHVHESAMQAYRIAPRVTAEQSRVAATRTYQPEQDADRRRLAGAVGAEEAVHLAAAYAEVEAVERAERAECLHQSGDVDDRIAWCCLHGHELPLECLG